MRPEREEIERFKECLYEWSGELQLKSSLDDAISAFFLGSLKSSCKADYVNACEKYEEAAAKLEETLTDKQKRMLSRLKTLHGNCEVHLQNQTFVRAFKLGAKYTFDLRAQEEAAVEASDSVAGQAAEEDAPNKAASDGNASGAKPFIKTPSK